MRSRAFHRNKKPSKIGEVLKEVISQLEGKKTDTRPIETILKEAVPKRLISHIRAEKKIGERLIIHVDSPPWLYEANKYRQKILETIQQRQGSSKTKQVCFRVGKIK